MTPGFITDIFGFALLIPPIRAALRAAAGDRAAGRPDPVGLLPLRPSAANAWRQPGGTPPPGGRRASPARPPRQPGRDLRLRRQRPRDPAHRTTRGGARSRRRRTAESAPDLVHQRRAGLLQPARGPGGRERPPGRRGRSGARPRPGRRRRAGHAAASAGPWRSPGAPPARCSSSRSTTAVVATYGSPPAAATRWRSLSGPGVAWELPERGLLRAPHDLGDHGEERPPGRDFVAARGRPRSRRGTGRRRTDHGPRRAVSATSSRCFPPSTTRVGPTRAPRWSSGPRATGPPSAVAAEDRRRRPPDPQGRLEAARFAWSLAGSPAVGGYEILTP